jgi:diguanylate cyclase
VTTQQPLRAPAASPGSAAAAAPSSLKRVEPLSSAQIAKATLTRLAQGRLEPTPENYARAWRECGGLVPRAKEIAAVAPPQGEDGAQWAQLVDQLVRGLEQGGRHWTVARRKESVKHVFASSGNHAQRLRERLTHLVGAWQTDGQHELMPASAPAEGGHQEPRSDAPATATDVAAAAWPDVAASLEQTLRVALPADDANAVGVAHELNQQAQRWRSGGADTKLAAEIEATCAQARRVFLQRHHLVDELGKLVRALSEGLTDLAEEESWARGQADAMRASLEGEALSVRGVRAAADMLTQTRLQQQRLRGERDRARGALRALVESLSSELQALGGQTGRFSDELVRCTDDLEHADSREQMSSVLHQMITASRSVQTEVADASARIGASRVQADELNSRVRELEGELQRLSEEVSTDALTQVANRRGLAQAFDVESARSQREGSPLAIGLIDIDNFKKLNDSLGHGAGDVALKALATQVRTALRPVDHVARFGGEEFVVLLPATAVGDAQEVLTRVQRGLSMSLFMHEGREVFVTFSAGVTLWQAGEPLGSSLERADSALYEAKRTGKNRTCVG